MLARIYRLSLVVLATALGGLSLIRADEPSKSDDPKGIEFFEAKIRPVLAVHCYKCHSAEAGKAEGSLQVDTRDRIRAGGDRGPAVVPRDAAGSILLTAISHADSDLQMPPKKDRLPQAVIADVRAWIEMGAPDPRVPSATTTVRPAVDVDAGRKFWAYQKPVAYPAPATKNHAWAERDL